MIHPDVLAMLAGESGRALGTLGVRPEDSRWIAAHAQTIASLAGVSRRRSAGERIEAALLKVWRRLGRNR